VQKRPADSLKFLSGTGNKIIDESVKLWDAIGNGFDPSVLKPATDSDPILSDDPERDRVNDKFWYRSFYTHIRTGQLMVLRPDEPDLYYYPEGRSQAGGGIERWLSEIHARLNGIRFALWVLIALAVIEVYLRWK
jgi:hypothetical protein